jgi:hypothetical protein
MAENQDVVVSEANRLYWTTELSVADVARELDVSRRALYDLVQPLPTDVHCEVCGSPLSYANRTARDAGRLECAACAELAAPPAATASDRTSAAAPAASRSPTTRRAAAAAAAENRRRAARRGGAALLGVLLGAGATVLATRD